MIYSTCPLCGSPREASFEVLGNAGDRTEFDCEVCGKFSIDGTLLTTHFNNFSPLSRIHMAALSHLVRTNQRADGVARITRNAVHEIIAKKWPLPTPALQAINIVRYIGEKFAKDGNPVVEFPPSFSSIVGAVNRRHAFSMLRELRGERIVNAIDCESFGDPDAVMSVTLTLVGWEKFEREAQGKFAGKYGFVALKFGDPLLDAFLTDQAKPLSRELGYDLVDMRETAQAGVIDNLMRSQIRDSAFVLADLTHDNPGAYWEAGYAEGLGKPVLYICERSKYEKYKTHFDTNHCTTVLWDADDTEVFGSRFLPTLRRSLGLL